MGLTMLKIIAITAIAMMGIACGGSGTDSDVSTATATSTPAAYYTATPAGAGVPPTVAVEPAATATAPATTTDPAPGLFDPKCDPEASGVPSSGNVRVGLDPFCVRWGETSSTGTYRIVLSYPRSEEEFEYETSAAAGEFVFPEESAHPAQGPSGTPAACTPRGGFQIAIWAGTTYVGGYGVGVGEDVCG
jgi:hypothetical protein